MAQNITWATDANVLAAMLDATLSVWLCPNCVHYSDRKVIRRTRIDKESRYYPRLIHSYATLKFTTDIYVDRGDLRDE